MIVQSAAGPKHNPYIYMFYSPCKDGESLHMPDCDDFIVFLVKKNKTLKAFRLFQCHCERKNKIYGRRRKDAANKTQRNKLDIPKAFPILQEMVQGGCFEGVPANFFS